MLRTDLRVRKGVLGIVEVKCLKVCPKGAVTVVSGARPDEWLLVPGGVAADEVMSALRPVEPLAGPLP